MTRAIEALNRWGLPVVTVWFLTIGFQTVVNAAAGLIRMPWLRYTLAMLVGCAAWAAIYATVGIAAFEASLALAAGSPWALGAVLVAILGVVITVVVLRGRSGAQGEQSEGEQSRANALRRADATAAGRRSGRDHRDPPTRLLGGGFA